MLSGFIGLFLVLLDLKGVLLGFTEFYRVLPSFSRVLPGCCRVLSGCSWCYLI